MWLQPDGSWSQNKGKRVGKAQLKTGGACFSYCM